MQNTRPNTRPNADSTAVDTTCFSLSTPGAGHDRVLAVTTPERTVLAVADGVGGQSGAREAASLAVGLLSSVTRRRDGVRRPDAWVRALRGIDLLVSSSQRAGQCTVVVAEVLDGWVFGASVGDAGAMLLPSCASDRAALDLTFAQRRKDRVGDGASRPVPFGPVRLADRLLVVASDGLFDYLVPGALPRGLGRGPLSDSVGALVESVRLPGGSFRDDVGLALCRHRPATPCDDSPHAPGLVSVESGATSGGCASPSSPSSSSSPWSRPAARPPVRPAAAAIPR